MDDIYNSMESNTDNDDILPIPVFQPQKHFKNRKLYSFKTLKFLQLYSIASGNQNTAKSSYSRSFNRQSYGDDQYMDQQQPPYPQPRSHFRERNRMRNY